MPTYDHGVSGLVGTIGVTILDGTGAVHVARTTAGITEPVAGSGVYYVADHDPDATLTYIWDPVEGGIGASETLYAGRESVPAIKAKTDTIGGAGAIDWTYTLTSDVDGSPIADAEILISTDSGAGNIVAVARADAAGIAAFRLDAGTYYVWRRKTGWQFTNPDMEVVA